MEGKKYKLIEKFFPFDAPKEQIVEIGGDEMKLVLDEFDDVTRHWIHHAVKYDFDSSVKKPFMSLCTISFRGKTIRFKNIAP